MAEENFDEFGKSLVIHLLILTMSYINHNLKCYSEVPYSGKVWRRECLANLLFSSVWQKKVWRMNRSAKWLLIVTTTLVWEIADDSPNFLPDKLSHYAVISLYSKAF